MPIVSIEISEGQSHEVKASIGKEITEIISRNTGMDPAKIIIFFSDIPRHNQCVGGEMRGKPPST